MFTIKSRIQANISKGQRSTNSRPCAFIDLKEYEDCKLRCSCFLPFVQTFNHPGVTHLPIHTKQPLSKDKAGPEHGSFESLIIILLSFIIIIIIIFSYFIFRNVHTYGADIQYEKKKYS